MELLSVNDALDQILSNFHPVVKEWISIENALNRVLAQPVIAPFDLPAFDNSSMDGFAVKASNTSKARKDNPVKLEVVADIPAGVQPEILINSGQAARIMTGAVLPKFADAVVPVEETDFDGRQPGSKAPEFVRIFKAVEPGGYIRPKGEDVKAGDTVMQPNRRLRAQEVGFLAMSGVSEISVYKKPEIALLSTGDELLNVGEPIKPGKIYDANAYTLASMVRQYGGNPVSLGISKDQSDEVRNRLDMAVKMGVDLIISSAGVSVGAFDFVRQVVEEKGELTFWRVNMRPGKPLAFGSYNGIPFIGLPGNPVSAFVGFEVFIRPAIMKMSGMKSWERRKERVILADQIESDGRESYLRAIVNEQNDQLIAHLTGHQGSGNLHSLVQSNALLIVPSEVKFLPAESELYAWIIGSDL